MIQNLTLARTEAEATAASSVDADHAALLVDSDVGADQDLDGERVAWTFPDGSLLVIEGPDFWVELSPDLNVSYYCVVQDIVEADGTRLLQCPISAKYATFKQAETALSKLAGKHPDAYIIQATLFCGDADARDSELAEIK